MALVPLCLWARIVSCVFDHSGRQGQRLQLSPVAGLQSSSFAVVAELALGLSQPGHWIKAGQQCPESRLHLLGSRSRYPMYASEGSYELPWGHRVGRR